MLAYRYNPKPSPSYINQDAPISREDNPEHIINRINRYVTKHNITFSEFAARLTPGSKSGKMTLTRLRWGQKPTQRTVDNINRVFGANNGTQAKISNSGLRL